VRPLRTAGVPVEPGSSTPARMSLWSLAPSSFLPALIYEIGNGAIAPVIALTALDVGAKASTAGFMLALLGIGQIIGDVPASSLANRIGDRRAMMLAAGVAVAALLCCRIATSLLVLGAALVVIGMANATFYLARQSYITEVVPTDLRARAISTLAGAHRIGLFIGPFIGALAISSWGLRSPFIVAMVAAGTAGLVLFLIPDLDHATDRPPAIRGGISTRAMVAAHRRLFATLGLGVLGVAAIRSARQTVLPLWAHHLGLSPATTSIIFGIANAVDMALFYPSGKVMDEYGRLAVAIPAVGILSAAMAALPLTRGAVSLTLVAMVLSFGNGIGSGIMMTIGADAAPSDGRIRFLSIWRVIADSGNAAGPIIVAVVATFWTLAAGIVVIGAVGFAGTAALGRWVPKYSPYATPASIRALRDVAERSP
jgi:MFS family permease